MGSLEDDRVSIIPNEEGNVVSISTQTILNFCSVCIFKNKLDISQLTYKQPVSLQFYGKKTTSGFLLLCE